MGNKTARKVTQAFIDGKRLKLGNYFTDGTVFALFGNEIAEKAYGGGFYIKDCGYCTATTSTALNALPGVRLRRLKDEWIWNEECKWDGESKFIEYNN